MTLPAPHVSRCLVATTAACLVALAPSLRPARATPAGVVLPGAAGAHRTFDGLPFSWRSTKDAATSPSGRALRAQGPAGAEQGGKQQAAEQQRATIRTGCTSDDECAHGTFCDSGRCAPVRRRSINVLYLFYRSADRRFTEVMGIYWHQRGKDGYRVVFPVYWHFWGEQERSRVIFPFYFRFEDHRERSYSTIVPPLQYRWSPRERNYRLWPLLFWTDYGERGAGLTVLPLFHWSREATRRSLILPPLLTGYATESARGRSRGLIAGLYYWHRDRSEGLATHAVFPVFYSSRSPSRAFAWALPLNFYSRRADRRKLCILPLLYHRADRRSSKTLSLVPPLYYSWRRSRSRLLLPPLLWYARDGHKSFWLLANIYRWRWPQGSSSGLFPLLFHRRARSSHTVVFPVLWHFRSPGRSTTVAGPVFHARRGPDLHAGALPLFYYRRVDQGQRSHFFSPLFLYERDARARVEQWGLLTPPYYRRRDADHAIDTLGGVIWRWHNKLLQTTTWVVPPAVFHSDPEGQTQVAFPFFWRFEDARSGNTTSVAFPLFYRHSNATEGTSFNLLFPLYYRNKRQGFSAGVFPVLFFGRQPQGRHLVIFPAVWHLAGGGRTTTVVGPLYHHHQRGRGWLAGLAPVLFFGDRDGDSHQVLFPLAWHLRSRSAGYDTTVVGPFFHARSPKGRLTGLVPLFVHGRWKGVDYTVAAPPLYYHHHDRARQERTTLAGGLFYRFRKQNRYGLGVLPLFHHRRTVDRDGRLSYATTLLPLFHYRRGADRQQLLLTPAGGLNRDPARGISQWMVGPFVSSRTRNARGFALLPLLLHWHRPAERSTTTVLLPFGVRHVSPQLTAHVWFPVLWRFSEPGERSLVVFPFYWRLRRDKGYSADVLFPVVWRLWNAERRLQIFGPAFSYSTRQTAHRGLVPVALYQRNQRRSYLAALPGLFYHHDFAEQQRTWVLGPLYLRSYRQGHGFGVFPLLFHKQTPQSRHEILVPVLWHFASRQSDTSTTFVGPLFHRRKAAHRAIGIAPVFYHGWDGAGSRTTALLPLFYHRAEPARRALFTPLFGYERSPDRKLWYAATALHARTPRRSISAALPLFFYHREHLQQRASLYLFPCYYGTWSSRSSFHLAFPLVWRFRSVDSASTVVFPFYWDAHDRKHTRTTVVFPLLFRHRNEPKRTTSYLAPPGVWLGFRPDGTDVVVFPLLWHYGSARRSTTVGFPLYWDFRRPGRRSTVLFPLFWRFDRDTHTTLVVLNSYYRRDKRHGTYRFDLIPLFNVQRRRPGDLKWELLTGLVGYERIGRNRFLTLFWALDIALDPLPGRKAPQPPPQSHSPPAHERGIKKQR